MGQSLSRVMLTLRIIKSVISYFTFLNNTLSKLVDCYCILINFPDTQKHNIFTNVQYFIAFEPSNLIEKKKNFVLRCFSWRYNIHTNEVVQEQISVEEQ